MTHFRRSLLSFLAATAIAGGATDALARSAPAQDAARPAMQGAVDAAALVVTPYTPNVFLPEQLRVAANQLFAEEVLVSTTDPKASPLQSGFMTLPHFVVLGQLLLIRDTPQRTKEIVATFEALEAQQAKRNQDVDDANRRSNEAGRMKPKSPEGDDEVEASESVEFRPRYVAFETLYLALKPFERTVRFAKEGGSAWTTRNLNPIPDGNLIIVCETPKRLETLKQLFDRIDRPQPQMILGVTLVRALTSEETKADDLPKELVQNLQAMVPAKGYRTLSAGALRCSMQSGQQCELKSEQSDDQNWTLSFFPGGFNPATNEFSINHCRFFRKAADPARGGSARGTQSFDTSLTFRAGEYVVLGGVGDVPTFVVLQVQPVREAN